MDTKKDVLKLLRQLRRAGYVIDSTGRHIRSGMWTGG
jgi:hypothetical protein